MEKIAETQEGRLAGKIIFTDEGKGILEGDLEKVMREKCNIYSDGGIIVHMTKREYENLEDEDYIRVPIEEYHRLLSRISD